MTTHDDSRLTGRRSADLKRDTVVLKWMSSFILAFQGATHLERLFHRTSAH
jgi:hypothetical protein